MIADQEDPQQSIVEDTFDHRPPSTPSEDDDNTTQCGFTPSLPETYRTVNVAPENAPWWRKLGSFTGIGFMVAVGYMDPGNWATDVAGGSKFGYDLLVVILVSSVAAMFLQFLCVKLGVATERDLAQVCREFFPSKVVFVLWIIMEIAMIATDMAELLGAAIALNLLCGLPLAAGVVIVGMDVMVILFLQQARLRYMEALIMALTFLIFFSLLYIVILAQPNVSDVMAGYIPQGKMFTNPDELFLAIGILGATIMPHNLFLHSSLIQSRDYPRTESGKKYAVKFGGIDSSLSLSFACVINSFILIVASAAFAQSYGDTEDIFQAYDRLTLALGTQTASTMFAVALLASGQQASLTGTMAGQIVMEGMLNWGVKPWKRRFVTRFIAIVPTIVVTVVMGNDSILLLIVSQVVISLTLSFATFPLLYFTSQERIMGKVLVNSWCTMIVGMVVVSVIAGFNLYLLATFAWDFS
jgi:manganese transport protein